MAFNSWLSQEIIANRCNAIKCKLVWKSIWLLKKIYKKNTFRMCTDCFFLSFHWATQQMQMLSWITDLHVNRYFAYIIVQLSFLWYNFSAFDLCTFFSLFSISFCSLVSCYVCSCSQWICCITSIYFWLLNYAVAIDFCDSLSQTGILLISCMFFNF